MANIERMTRIANIDRRIAKLETEMQEAWTKGGIILSLSEEISMLREARTQLMNIPSAAEVKDEVRSSDS